MHMVEEIFIHQILDFIKKFGVQAMSREDYKQFKRIVDDRMKVMTTIQKQLEFQKILEIKKHNREYYNQR